MLGIGQDARLASRDPPHPEIAMRRKHGHPPRRRTRFVGAVPTGSASSARSTPVLLVLALAVGCGGDREATESPEAPDQTGPIPTEGVPAPEDIFLENLAFHCGSAFPGGLELTPEGDAMLTGTEELLVHFRDCEPGEVRIPFHVEVEATGSWDRSRTWYVMRRDEGLELRHDHREPDGTESTRTWYGGFSMAGGTATRQDFASPERTRAAGVPVGWRIEIEPGRSYRYGTTYDGEYDWMIEFDLSSPVRGEIPGAWGAETPPSRNPGPP